MDFIDLAESVRLPVVAEADVVIAGGGPAGLGAALFSARNGAKTLLVENYGLPGGMAVIAEVTPFISNYGGKQCLDGPVYPEWRRAMERYLPEEIASFRRARPESMTGRSINKEAAALAAEDLLLDAGVRLLYHHQVTGAVMEGRQIRALRCHSKGGEVAVRGKCFVDCTGDGDLAVLAGCGYNLGNDREDCQPMTLCFKLSHVETDWNRENNDTRIFDLRKRLNQGYREAVKNGEISCPRNNVLLFSFELEDDHVVHFNTTRVLHHNPVDGLSLSDAEIEGRRQLREIYQWLRRDFPEFRESRLMSMGVQIGVRESRHIHGLYQLTAGDFRSCARFEDAVARCSYSMDMHSPVDGGTKMEFIREGDFYEIPYRSLLPVDCDNLIIGGRPISSDSGCHSSFRIMSTAIAIGQAAGLAAALASENHLSPRQIDGSMLRDKLISQGVPLA